MASRSAPNANPSVKERARRIDVYAVLFAHLKKRKALIFAGFVCMNGKVLSQLTNVVGNKFGEVCKYLETLCSL